MKYKKKPVVIDALEWTGGDHRGMSEFLGSDPSDYLRAEGDNFYIDHSKTDGGLVIKTSEGDMVANIGDYIIKEPFDKDRMFYPCKPDIFHLTYDKVED